MGKSRSATILLAYLLWSTRQHANANSSPQQSSEDPDMVSLPTKPLTVIKALELLRQGRPIAEPNEGFMDQLHMYEAMGCPTSEAEMKKHKIYRRWMNKRSVEESLRVNMAPEMAAIKFEDESDDDDEEDGENDEKLRADPSAPKGQETRSQGQVKGKGVTSIAPGIKAPDGTSSSSPSLPLSRSSVPTAAGAAPASSTDQQEQSPPSPQVTLKCRKCRHILATTPFILTHIPPPHTDPSFQASGAAGAAASGSTTQTHSDKQNQIVGSPSKHCAHVFLHPLSWMRPVLSEGQMEGRLSCPKCTTNVGKFAWSGLRCSCGGWVTPGFGVTRGKVDEVVVSVGVASRGVTGGATTTTTGGGGSGLRLPPGMRRGGGNL